MAQAVEIVKNLVPQIAKEQNFVNYDSKVVPISSGGANYASVLYNITLSEGDRVIHMFAKVAAMGEQMRSQIPSNMYEREIFAYTNLSKVYARLQDEHQVPEEHRLSFSKFYGCNRTMYEETVVLENLVMSGYQSFDRFTSIDWEYAKAAVCDLAKMHALSYAYSEYYTEEFNKVIGEFLPHFDAFRSMKDYFKKPYMQATEAVREDTKDKLQRYADNFGMDMFVDYITVVKRPVLGHGDFRPSNLLHRIREDGTVDIKIVDLQTLQGASPVIDLLYFIFTGSDEQFRAQYYDKLIDHYYTQLAAAMRRLHLDPDKIYHREDFDYELKEKLPFGLTIAVFALPLLTVSAEDAPKVNEDMDMSSFVVESTSDLYTERLNGVVNDYVKWALSGRGGGSAHTCVLSVSLPPTPLAIPVSLTLVSAQTVDRSMEFTDDPFKDYRYEDPFNIEDPFADVTDSRKPDPFGRPTSVAGFETDDFFAASSTVNGSFTLPDKRSGCVSAPPVAYDPFSSRSEFKPAPKPTASATSTNNNDTWAAWPNDNWATEDAWAKPTQKSDAWATDETTKKNTNTSSNDWKTDNWANKSDNWATDWGSPDNNKNLNETWPSSTLPSKKEKSPKPLKYKLRGSLVHTIGGIGRTKQKDKKKASLEARSAETLPTEEQQWAWANSESKRLQAEAEERRRREDAELQLALAISRQEK